VRRCLKNEIERLLDASPKTFMAGTTPAMTTKSGAENLLCDLLCNLLCD